MSLTSIIKESPEIQNFLVSRIKTRPKIPDTKNITFSNNVNPSMVGTAFDYMFRFELKRKYPWAIESGWIAQNGLSNMVLAKFQVGDGADSPHHLLLINWADTGQRTMDYTKSAREKYYKNPSDKNLRKLVEMCYRLSYLDVIYREGKLPSVPVPKDKLMPAPTEEEIDDIISMISKSEEFINSETFANSKFIVLNPDFGDYSKLVRGADADIITSTSLIDLKTSRNLRITNYDLAQIVGYYFLLRLYNEEHSHLLIPYVLNEMKMGRRFLHERYKEGEYPMENYFFSQSEIYKFPDISEIGIFFSRYGMEYTSPVDNVSINREDLIKFEELIKDFKETRQIQIIELMKLKDVGSIRSRTLTDMGIKTIEELANFPLSRGKRVMINNVGFDRLHTIAREYLDHKIELRKNVTIDEAIKTFDFSDEVYLDIETTGLLSNSQIWLIGMWFKRENKLISLFASEPSKEKTILKQYLQIVSGIRGAIVTFSGKGFDNELIESRLKEYRLWYKSKPPVYLDILQVIRRSVFIPASNGLKNLAEWMGYTFKHPDLSGAAMPQLYNEYLNMHDQKLYNNLIEYNEDDVKSLSYVVDFIRHVLLERKQHA
ncbi:MAG: ribonuclease H-like domain-containing protein [Ferroplasma sp.]|uniref:ribonuclease H-like domain-containing protein n=1 Tax=Ferroplasma sp. TaxID=2591003 RepID=UPI0028168440|nr:ribonuclease H-like domain-containing protein [Ferroplasma sp.]WMT50829.1 MAG: ribonuclease H-like domain-containing protein [Ferroplasma sp.]